MIKIIRALGTMAAIYLAVSGTIWKKGHQGQIIIVK